MLSENIKMDMLNKLLIDDNKYNATLWGVIIADTNVISSFAAYMDKHGLVGGSYSAFNNQYCFIGITDSYISFAGIDNLNPLKNISASILPLSDIKKVQIKRGLFGRTKVLILTKDGILKLLLARNTIGTKLKKDIQINGINYLVNTLKSLDK